MYWGEGAAGGGEVAVVKAGRAINRGRSRALPGGSGDDSEMGDDPVTTARMPERAVVADARVAEATPVRWGCGC